MISLKNKENYFFEKESENETTTNDNNQPFSNPSKRKFSGNIPYQPFLKVKKESDKCYINSYLDKFGSLYVNSKNFKKYHLATIKQINFPLNREIFEKGKNDPKFLFKKNMKTIPEAKFWNQRYYYYSKYDEGIQMDYESIYLLT